MLGFIFTHYVESAIMKVELNVMLYEKEGDLMTGKAAVNLIRKLREKGIDSNEILEIIEYIETHEQGEDNSRQE